MFFRVLFLLLSMSVLSTSFSFAGSSNGIPAGLDAGAILASQMRNWSYQQQLFYLNGPITSEDLKPKEPVIIDETGILSKHKKDVHGAVTDPVRK